jgi:YNFM family putative membrane transporter
MASPVHFRDAGLTAVLFLEAFVLMGAFVTLFNYIGYRLLAAPYNLESGVCGSAVSVVYLSGIYSSAKIGSLADKLGRRKVLWADHCVMMFAGLALTLFITVASGGNPRHVDLHLSASSARTRWRAAGLAGAPLKAKRSGIVAVSVQLLRRLEYCRAPAGGVFWHLGGMERHRPVHWRVLLGGGAAGGVAAGEVAASRWRKGLTH